MQNNNTSISDSEICETAERLERLAKSLNIPNLDQYRSLFKPEEKNQINSHQQKDLSPSKKKDSKEQDNKKQDSEKQNSKKKKSCYFCKSKKHEDKICPAIIKKNTRGQKRKSDGNSDIPKKNSK